MSQLTRQKDKDWCVATAEGRLYDPSYGFQPQSLAVLMDIRDELKRLNSLLHCHNFTDIPFVLRSIKQNTVKPKPRKKKAV